MEAAPTSNGNGVAATPPLTFVRRPTPRHLNDLSDIDAAQLKLAGQLYHGLELPLETLLHTDDTPDDDEMALCFLERWDVYAQGDEDTVLYDAWMYMVDSGTVFRHATTGVVSEIIQFGFDPSSRPGEEEVPPGLCEALGAAYDAAKRAARDAAAVAAEA